MRPSLCTINIPTTNFEKSTKFYNYLCEYEFAQALTEEVDSRSVPISRDGIFLQLTQQLHEGEHVVCYFGVKDLNKAIEELQKLGGKLMAGPFDLPVPPGMVDELRREYRRSLKRGEEIPPTTGKSAILQDPHGNGVGLLSLESHAHKNFCVGDHYRPVTETQLKEHKRAIARGRKVKVRKRG